MLSSLYIGRQISQEMNFSCAINLILTFQKMILDTYLIFQIHTHTHACVLLNEEEKCEIFFVFHIFSDIYILFIINMKVNILLLYKYWSQKKIERKLNCFSYEMNMISFRNTIKIQLMSPFFQIIFNILILISLIGDKGKHWNQFKGKTFSLYSGFFFWVFDFIFLMIRNSNLSFDFVCEFMLFDRSR